MSKNKKGAQWTYWKMLKSIEFILHSPAVMRSWSKLNVVIAMVLLCASINILLFMKTNVIKWSVHHTSTFMEKGTSRNKQKLENISARFQDRRNHLLRVCNGNEEFFRGDYPLPRLTRHLYLHNRTKPIIFCGIEKVALSLWRRIFKVLNHPCKFSSPYDINAFYAFGRLANLEMFETNDTQISQIMGLANSIVFSRNPYARLYSAYMDKLQVVNHHYMLNIGKTIVQTYRPNASNVDINCGHDVTFEEFVQFFIDHVQQPHSEKKDDHFMTMTEHCRPCDYKYKFLGKSETFFEDLDYISKTLRLNISTNIIKEEYEMDIIQRVVEYLFHEYFTFPSIQCFSLKFAIQRAWLYFKSIGLISNKYDVPLMNESESNITRDVLTKTIIKYVDMSHKDKNLKLQKRDFIVKAYNTVAKQLKWKLKSVFKADCDIFDYDCEPP